MKKQKSIYFITKGGKLLFTFLPIVLMIILIEYIGIGRSILVYLLYVLIILLYKMYHQRAFLLTNLKVFESKLFGKPLDRDMWDKGEIKKVKIKVGWGPKKKRTDLDDEYNERLNDEVVHGE